MAQEPANPLVAPGSGAQAPLPAPVRFGEALRFWLKLGFISFGGPAGQIAILHEELVDRRRWISERRFLHALNYCMVLPGPEAQQLATYIGWLMHRTGGGIVAGALFVLPSLLILIGLAWVYVRFGSVSWVAGLFYGVKPAVTALVLQAAHRIGSRVLRNAALWAIALLAFAALSALHLPFPAIVLGAGLCGHIGRHWRPTWFCLPANAHAAGTVGRHLPALIDDDTPSPPHARFSWTGLARVALSGLALWGATLWALAMTLGLRHPFTQMGWFFTKAALLTFGGAYAVLPYVYQGAVVDHHWLTASQMIDGLALGETTPGPLIMVVAFVGYLGGQGVFGPGDSFAAGATAAALVTWFTFLPSFVLILAGGPLVESTHGELGWTAPLTAITAAVVGVIANLALFFGYRVLWPHGWPGGLDVVCALLIVGAAVALIRFKRHVIEVIAACAALGWLATWWGPGLPH